MKRTPEIDKKYVSPYDKLLHGFDATHAPSTSQQREISKYEALFRLRDEVIAHPENKQLWDKF
ncbi:MAG: hypothetical protein P1U39_02770 [Legionellaceae bacterium]|nr:hypothetical protein [Legionellaceae bacterium]